MKKPTTTVEAFASAVDRLNDELGLAEALGAANLADEADFARLTVDAPEPAPAVGRGDRVTVEVVAPWNGSPCFGQPDRPLEEVRRRVALIQGVEEVGPTTTWQGLIWGFSVILRLSQ